MQGLDMEFDIQSFPYSYFHIVVLHDFYNQAANVYLSGKQMTAFTVLLTFSRITYCSGF